MRPQEITFVGVECKHWSTLNGNGPGGRVDYKAQDLVSCSDYHDRLMNDYPPVYTITA